MIIRMLSAGKSFKGLSAYLTHDAGADTDDRVAWIHTHNLAFDDAKSAVDEMVWTARNAEVLKQEAGIRAGGRPTENPVKHFSLNWSPEENPTREHMVEATEDFLRHMNWSEHQALLVSHDEKSHPHVHVMLNTVHPDTGLKLDDGFEYRRAQKWALEYELEHGLFCENRLENVENREESPTRPMWTAFDNSRAEFDRDEKARGEMAGENKIDADNPENAKSREWQALKEFQRSERTEFFADGKLAFSELRRSITVEIRDEFRERWADYFEAVKSGGNSDELDRYKADLVAEQKSTLDTRRDAACAELRETRDITYRELLDDQRELRTGLAVRQEAGLDCSLFLKLVEEGGFSKSSEMKAAFRDTADEITIPVSGHEPTEDRREAPVGIPARDSSGMRSAEDIGIGVGLGLASGIGSIAGSLADSFVGSSRAPRAKPREPERTGENLFDAAARETARNADRKREEDEANYLKRQRDNYWE